MTNKRHKCKMNMSILFCLQCNPGGCTPTVIRLIVAVLSEFEALWLVFLSGIKPTALRPIADRVEQKEPPAI